MKENKSIDGLTLRDAPKKIAKSDGVSKKASKTSSSATVTVKKTATTTKPNPAPAPKPKTVKKLAIKEVLEPKINVYRLNGDFKATINEVIQSRETDLKIEEENKIG